jgi:hypothetical protein
MRIPTKRSRTFIAAAAGVLVLGLACTAIASAGTRGGGNPNTFPAAPTLYNSMTVSANYVWSYAFDATGANQLGNDITLANGGGRLNDVVVSMGNFAPASQSAPLAMTLNVYNPSANPSAPEPGNGVTPGSLIATDTVTITPPGTATGFTGTPPTYGIDNFNVTFNFESQKISLPDEVVYDIAYNNTTVDTGLNVNLSYESSSVPSVGADTYPGYLFVATGDGMNGATGGPNGEITCQPVSSTLAQYSTQPTTYGSTACGLAALPAGPGLLVPAVEFTTGTH